MIDKNILQSQPDSTAMARTAKNLAYLMNTKGVDASALSDATGLGIATVNSLRRGVGNPTLSTIAVLASFFKIGLGELTEVDLSERGLKQSSVQSIPLIKLNYINKFINNEFYPYDTYTTELDDALDGPYFAVLINNDSLLPQFSSGTVFVLSRHDEFCDGDVVLIRIGTHNPCFRKLFIAGDNFLFSPIAIESGTSPSIYIDYQIIGVVLKAIKTLSGR